MFIEKKKKKQTDLSSTSSKFEPHVRKQNSNNRSNSNSKIRTSRSIKKGGSRVPKASSPSLAFLSSIDRINLQRYSFLLRLLQTRRGGEESKMGVHGNFGTAQNTSGVGEGVCAVTFSHVHSRGEGGGVNLTSKFDILAAVAAPESAHTHLYPPLSVFVCGGRIGTVLL